MPTNSEIIADLNRAKCVFQLRAIATVMDNSPAGSWADAIAHSPCLNVTEYPADLSHAGSVATDHHNAGQLAADGDGLSFNDKV